MLLFYTCPKRKCREAWSERDELVINSNCPKCGATNICPVDVERDEECRKPFERAA